MHALLTAVMDLGRDLDLPQVLRSIVEAAVTLTEARYGALGVIGDDGAGLSQFVTVGMDAEVETRIGPAPCGHLTTLSIAAGVAIDNARLYEESRRREHRLEALGEITRALLAGIGTDEVLRIVARRAMEVADADLATVLLPTGSGDLVVRVAHGEGAEAVRGAVLPVAGSLSGLAAAERAPVVTTDVRVDARARPLGGAEHGPVVAVPLRVDAAVCGAL
ncbi:GAF domain-containing protein, partial [Streptomyces sp. NEAU-H3]|uniref:GAF domain-containing protein n=1 Tax=Streptomyces sp. NEAU-H3 TaxID=2720636 RepID=UPI001439544B